VLAASISAPGTFEILVDRYQSAFVRKARSIVGPREEVADIVMETFTKIYANAGRFKEVPGASFSSWGYKILINTALTYYQKLKRRNGVVVELETEHYESLADNRDDFKDKEIRDMVAAFISKLPNLITGKVTERSFHQSESVAEANIETRPIDYIYKRDSEIWFNEHDNPKERFILSKDLLGGQSKFLKEKMTIDAVVFNDKIIGVRLPIKLDLKVIDAPPAVKGNTAQGANKQVTLETDVIITVPMFINEGDIIRVNTETGEYTERVEKR